MDLVIENKNSSNKFLSEIDVGIHQNFNFSNHVQRQYRTVAKFLRKLRRDVEDQQARQISNQQQDLRARINKGMLSDYWTQWWWENYLSEYDSSSTEEFGSE